MPLLPVSKTNSKKHLKFCHKIILVSRVIIDSLRFVSRKERKISMEAIASE